MSDDNIFTNQEEVIEGIRASAEAIGIDPDAVMPKDGEEQKNYYARSNCQKCFGRGFLTFVPSPQKLKMFWVTKGPTGKFTKRKTRAHPNGRRRGTSEKSTKILSGYAPSRDDLSHAWDGRTLSEARENRRGTCRPEPQEYKSQVAQRIFCKCVREK